jgi:hypothetical protein
MYKILVCVFVSSLQLLNHLIDFHKAADKGILLKDFPVALETNVGLGKISALCFPIERTMENIFGALSNAMGCNWIPLLSTELGTSH